MLRQLVYTSKAIPDLDGDQIENILRTSTENNLRQGITGVLCYHNGQFRQLLEGTPLDVEVTILRIKSDPRHRDLKIDLDCIVDERLFMLWAMGFSGNDEIIQKTFPRLIQYYINVFDDSLFDDQQMDDKAFMLIKDFVSQDKDSHKYQQ